MRRQQKFSLLLDAVKQCRLCPRLAPRTKILSENNGNIYSSVVFIAEAPGRRGADRTRVPLFGDQSGHNFQHLLDSIGWSREHIFITNAVLCNPRDDTGKNDTPRKFELANCSLFLEILIEIINPEYIVTLGQTALQSLNVIRTHKISLAKDVRTVLPWHERRVIPLYHTSPRAMIQRRLYRQLEDFNFLKNEIEIALAKKPRKLQVPFQVALFDEIRPTKLQKLATLLLKKLRRVSRFKLTKLIYLVDYHSLRSRKRLITDAFYVRAADGPIQTSLSRALSQLEGKELRSIFYRRKPYVELGANPRFEPHFKGEELEIIVKVLQKYIDKDDTELKTATYLTKPMRRLLRLDRVNRNKIKYGVPLFTPEDLGAQ